MYGKMQESGFIKILPEIYICLRTCLPRVQRALSCFSSWVPLKLHCGWTAAVTDDLILVELMVDNILYFYNPLLFSLNFDHDLGGILWLLCLMRLGTLLPRLGKDFFDRLLNVLLVDKTLLTVARASGQPVIWSGKWFPLVASSHI